MKARIFIGSPPEAPDPGRWRIIGGHECTWPALARKSKAWASEAHDGVIFLGAEKLFRDRTKTAEIARLVSRNCGQRWATLGSPPRRPIDWWNLLDTLDPGNWGSFWKFAERYCNPHKRQLYRNGPSVWDFSGSANESELRERLSGIVEGLPEDSEADDARELAALGEKIAAEGFEERMWVEDAEES